MLFILYIVACIGFVSAKEHVSRKDWLIMPPTGQPTGEPSSVPSGEPTGIPTFIPSAIPTNRPTSTPTGSPSGQPSTVPSSFPTNTVKPTAVPTKVPTRNPTLAPTFLTYNIQSLNLTDNVPVIYFCHSAQVWKTPNAWQFIFMDSTVSIGGYVDLHHVEIWVTPYTSGIDELRIFDSDEANFIMRYRAYESNDGMGKLRITKTSNPQAAWSDVAGVLNMMQYRFVDDNTYPNRCYKQRGVTKTIHLQMTDDNGKQSIVVTRDIVIQTATVMYTDALPAVLTDKVHSISITYLNPDQYDPDFTSTQEAVNYYVQDTSVM